MGGGGNGGITRCQSAVALSEHNHKQEKAPTTTTTTSTTTNFGELEPTALYLSSSPTGVSDERLLLPRIGTAPCSLDVYLQSIPSVSHRSEALLRQSSSSPDDLLKSAARSQKCLTVLQGEVAHASETQTDLLVSGEATTCHVVALRSTHSSKGAALASMAHVDQSADVYERCLEQMAQEHLQHHLQQAQAQALMDEGADDYGFYDSLAEEEESVCEEDCLTCAYADDENDDDSSNGHCSKDHDHPPSYLPQPDFGNAPNGSRRKRSQSMPSLQTEPIEMELHIAGGYLDEEGTSQNLSTSLVHSFSKLAHKYQNQLRISLSTAAISSMNTSDDARPRSRGLALNTKTGQVTPITTALPAELDGPAMELRTARLLSDHRRDRLSVIHTKDGNITIDPFQYLPQPEFNALLQAPDPVLLKLASTSPDCESERFCQDLRRTLSFVNTVPSETVFGGNNQERPLVYSRSSQALNQWEPVV